MHYSFVKNYLMKVINLKYGKSILDYTFRMP